jgi:hypothetical protein
MSDSGSSSLTSSSDGSLLTSISPKAASSSTVEAVLSIKHKKAITGQTCQQAALPLLAIVDASYG